MSSLLDKVSSAGSIKDSCILADSIYLTEKSSTTTDLPTLNIAFSGQIDGGFSSGITILAGDTKTFKTLTALYCMKAYLDANPDGIGIIYDSEFGITPQYLITLGIDVKRVLHIPIQHVEELKFDIVKRLEPIKRGEKAFIMIDSLGLLPSKKEIDDAIEDKSVADMTRAKAIRSLFRMVTSMVALRDLPLMVINHCYVEIGPKYPRAIVSGGTAVVLAADTVFINTKSQEKDGMDLEGFSFTITIDKSRTVQEKSKLTFTVLFDGGIQKYSGLLELAIESGYINVASKGWYELVDKETGEIVGTKMRRSQVETEEVLGQIIKKQPFKDHVIKSYRL